MNLEVAIGQFQLCTFSISVSVNLVSEIFWVAFGKFALGEKSPGFAFRKIWCWKISQFQNIWSPKNEAELQEKNKRNDKEITMLKKLLLAQ